MKKCDFTEKVQENSVAVWLFAVCGFLLGIIIGFCMSPMKKGICIGSYNSNNSAFDDCDVKYNDTDEEDDEE